MGFGQELAGTGQEFVGSGQDSVGAGQELSGNGSEQSGSLRAIPIDQELGRRRWGLAGRSGVKVGGNRL